MVGGKRNKTVYTGLKKNKDMCEYCALQKEGVS